MEQRSHPAGQREDAMTVTVNGQARLLPEGCTVADLVTHLGLGQRACAVEVDRALVPRKDHSTRRLHSGASIEIVTLVGGG